MIGPRTLCNACGLSMYTVRKIERWGSESSEGSGGGGADVVLCSARKIFLQ